MNELLVVVIGGLSIAALTWAAKHVFDKYWYRQPRVHVHHVFGGSSSSADGGGGIRLQWDGRLEFYNGSPHDALALELVWPNGRPVLELTGPAVRHVRGLEFIEATHRRVSRHVRSSDIADAGDRWTELIPDDVASFELLLRYENDRGKAFYSHYRKHAGTENVTFHRIRPTFRTV